MTVISSLHFGEYDAFDENKTNPDFFEDTFVLPFSFSMDTLKNSKNFIIVGKKGAGKTSAQMHLRRKLERQGYFTGFFSFFEDISPKEYSELAKSQRIEFLGLDIAKIKNMAVYYDFKQVWLRVFLVQICNALAENNVSNTFTAFVMATTKKEQKGILNGILKSFKIELTIPLFEISPKLSFDPSNLISSKNEMDIESFNRIASELLFSECAGLKLYMFVDELVFSKFDSRDDEIKIRAALVRDVLRVASKLNGEFCEKKMDFHFVCSLRPEIRYFLNELDSEISKVIDSKDVLLHWDSKEEETNILITLFYKKISKNFSSDFNVREFVEQEISFSGNSLPIERFLLNNSWYRPRDIIRFLKSYQKMNPMDTRMTAVGFKKSLNEYSRVSAKEVFDELSVSYDAAVVNNLKNFIRSNYYRNVENLMDVLAGIGAPNLHQFCNDMFTAGIIGNIEGEGRNARHFWSHREDEFLDDNRGIRVHPGLWNFLNIRGG